MYFCITWENNLHISEIFRIFARSLCVQTYTLIDGMSKEELVSGCSRPRNREIMRIFKDVDLVEQLGTGMNRMMKVYTPDIFVVSPNFFHTIFNYNRLPDNQEEGLSVENSEKSTLTGTRTGTLTGTLTGTRKSIVEIISENPNVTISQIATKLEKNPRGIDKHIQKLRELGILRRVDGDFGGHWEIIEK